MIKFMLGESRSLEFEISHKDNVQFIISDAKYELYKNNELIKEEDLFITENIVSLIFTPEERGFYLLKILYTIGGRTRGAQYHIDVD